MTSSPRPEIVLSPLEESNFDALGRAHLGSMLGDRVYERRSPLNRRPEWEQRIADYVYLRTTRPPIPSYKHELKATLASDPSTLVGFVVWEESPDRTATGGHPTEEEAAAAKEEAEKQKSERRKMVDRQFDQAFLDECGRLMNESRTAVMGGRMHWYLALIFVAPGYQGLGIASVLLNYGLSRADEAGLPCYLESSVRGQPVYAAKGFEVVRTMKVEDDVTEGGYIVVPAMVRPPRTPVQTKD